MYDPARDSDGGDMDAEAAAPASPGDSPSKKRKRDNSNENNTQAHQDRSTAASSSTTPLPATTASTNTSANDTGNATSSAAPPKAMTAANLSKLTSHKKRPEERTAGPSKPKRPTGGPSTGQTARGRSPLPASGGGTPTNSTPRRVGRPGSPSRVGPPRRTPPPARSPRPISRSPSRSPPRKLKRPGASARVAAIPSNASRGGPPNDGPRQGGQPTGPGRGRDERDGAAATKSFYNNATLWDRRERQEKSEILGLRNLNNWIKSVLIQKFSPNEGFEPAWNGFSVPDRRGGGQLKVLDLGCGKAGDLQKWAKAPQKVSLLVGVDPAEALIGEARERYFQARRNNRDLMHAEFVVRDAFGKPLHEIPIVDEVGFDRNMGPGGDLNAKRWGRAGFDVVSMMFCLHYSFENEQLARGMLSNVSGALRKGGRFLGVIVDSDIISAKVAEYYRKDGQINAEVPLSSKPTVKDAPSASLQYDEPESQPSKQVDDEDDDWDPEKPSEAAPNNSANGLKRNGGAQSTTKDDSDSDWDPEKPSTPLPAANAATAAAEPNTQSDNHTNDTTSQANGTSLPNPHWHNSVYSIKFLSAPARDGTFRPPFGWRYDYNMKEAVATPEYVVPWEALRALALDYDLELQYKKSFLEVWETERHDPEFRRLSERMRVVGPDGRLAASKEEIEASGIYCAFCFYKM